MASYFRDTTLNYNVQSMLCSSLDWMVIRWAAWHLRKDGGTESEAGAAASLLSRPDFFSEPLTTPRLEFEGPTFRYPSPVATPYAENNQVWGNFFGKDQSWRRTPQVILLHGWNDEISFCRRFPVCGAELNQRGFGAFALQLPYHLQRRPGHPSAVRDFISGNVHRSVEAVRQAVLDVRALIQWLRAEGCPQVGIWGLSLGAWLGGLTACHEPGLDFIVLTTPVANLERTIGELSFCGAIRAGIEGKNLPLRKLDLGHYQRPISGERILIVEAKYDRFVRREGVESLWEAWERPDIHRYPQGHISLLLSKTIRWQTMEWMQNIQQMGSGKNCHNDPA